MSEPRRLLDEGGSELERSLLRSARDDAPAPNARRKTMVALALAGGVGVTATTATSTAATALGTTGTTALLKWIGMGVIAGLVTVGAVAVVPAQRGETQALVASKGNAAKAASLEAQTASAVAAAASTAVEAPAPSAAEVAAPVAEAVPSATAAPHASAKAVEKPSLADEVASLDAAREALGSGNAGGALRALDDHDRRFAGGALGPEALVLRIQALVQRGDRASASRLGEAYLAAHPRSPHANRVRSLLGTADPAP